MVAAPLHRMRAHLSGPFTCACWTWWGQLCSSDELGRWDLADLQSSPYYSSWVHLAHARVWACFCELDVLLVSVEDAQRTSVLM
jgi:hypothetical protein